MNIIDQYRRGVSGPFDPLTLPSIQLWGEANLSVFQDNTGLIPCNFDGCNLKNWGDLSGAGSALTTSGNCPVWKTNIKNGLPVARFAASPSIALSSSQANNQKPRSVGFVGMMPHVNNNNTIFDGSSGGNGMAFDTNANNFRFLKANTALIGANTTTLVDSTFYIVFVTYDGSGNYVWYLNGAADGSGTNNQTFSNSLTALGDSNVGGARFEGDMCAFVQGGGAWSSTDVGNMTTYWNNKWAIF